MTDLPSSSYSELVPVNGMPKTKELSLRQSQDDPLDCLSGQDAYPVPLNLPAWDTSAGPCAEAHGEEHNMLEDNTLSDVVVIDDKKQQRDVSLKLSAASGGLLRYRAAA
ncbi:hypothetical protein NDU88_002528 [Pleurodeles waltl]|uniref:Prolactin receptor n=1 Tax=Pleurodeles waltl TaxID=8319 RepID=A0AAV7RC93_PLEWA|nr:hypothetical protein NDU88_002528 [Pleurodeles waltl]